MTPGINDTILQCNVWPLYSPSQHHLNPSHPILNEIQRHNDPRIKAESYTGSGNNSTSIKFLSNESLPNVLPS